MSLRYVRRGTGKDGTTSGRPGDGRPWHSVDLQTYRQAALGGRRRKVCDQVLVERQPRLGNLLVEVPARSLSLRRVQETADRILGETFPTSGKTAGKWGTQFDRPWLGTDLNPWLRHEFVEA